MNAKHTPGKLSVGRYREGHIELDGPNGTVAGYFTGVDSPRDIPEDVITEAENLCMRVNCHDELLAALSYFVTKTSLAMLDKAIEPKHIEGFLNSLRLAREAIEYTKG